MKNTLKEKLAQGKKPIGTFFELGSPDVIEALGRTGLDASVLITAYRKNLAEIRTMN